MSGKPPAGAPVSHPAVDPALHPLMDLGPAVAAFLAFYGGVAIGLANVAVRFETGLPLEPASPLVSWYAATALLALCLAALSAIDLKTFRLPNTLTLPLIAAGCLLPLVMDTGVSSIWPIVWRAGAAAGAFAVLAGLAIVYERLRGRPGLGLGDAKLFAAAGSWLGAEPLALVMLIASLSALAVVLLKAVRDRRLDPGMRLAFGPYIALGFWIVWVYPK
ncbi:MAG: A24 family peptidase [Hyphomicrobium sp.]